MLSMLWNPSGITTCCPNPLLLVFFFFFFFQTDSNPDCSTDSQGGPFGLPQAVARAYSHSARLCEGSGWPAAAQSTANLLPCHKNPSVQMSGAGQATFPGCKFTVLLLFFCRHSLLKTFTIYSCLNLIGVLGHSQSFPSFYPLDLMQ